MDANHVEDEAFQHVSGTCYKTFPLIGMVLLWEFYPVLMTNWEAEAQW